MGRFIDPRTDFGFKRLFGQEDSKDILRQFLFDVLALPHPIAELTYIPVEQLPASSAERRGIYDIYCVDIGGRRFIVEMQQGLQRNIKERALYYTTFPITYQARRGAEWQFDLLPVYCIAILNFVMIDDDERYLRQIQWLATETKTVWYEKLTFVFIELAKFNRTLTDASPADKWVYLLRNLPAIQDIPVELASESFAKAFAIAEEAALTPEERWFYEGSLKEARDANARLSYARETSRAEGRAEGRTEGKLEVARSLLARGFDRDIVREVTGLTEAELSQLIEGTA
jgi:predicted transposase/invertase (TIGR01784 family)